MDKVILRVEGGRVTSASAPGGIDVVVFDLDVDGEDEINGRSCLIETVDEDEDFASAAFEVLQEE